MPEGCKPLPLRTVILAQTGQDVRKCSHCSFCVEHTDEDDDLSLETMLQLVMMNDEEVLTCRSLWSERTLEEARESCIGALDLAAIILALRAEARRRGLVS